MRIENINNTSFNAKFKIDSNGNLQSLWKNANKSHFNAKTRTNFDTFQQSLPEHEIEIKKITSNIHRSTKMIECFNNKTGSTATLEVDENNKMPLIEQLVVGLIDFYNKRTEQSWEFWDDYKPIPRLFRIITGQ